MSKAITISIPTPCNENWNAMTPNNQGRFCGVCSKTVIDFTGMADAAIYNIFDKHKEGGICGRFRNDQLNRNMLPLQTPQWYKANIWKYAIAGTLIFAAMQQQASAQVKHETLGRIQVKCPKPKDNNKPIMGEISQTIGDTIVAKEIRNFSIKLHDENGKPVLYAYIKPDHTQTKITEKGEGFYNIQTNTNIVKMVIRHPDFVLKTLEVDYSKQFIQPHIIPAYLRVNLVSHLKEDSVNSIKAPTHITMGIVAYVKSNDIETTLSGTRNISFSIIDEKHNTKINNATISYTMPKTKDKGIMEKVDDTYLLQHKLVKGSLKVIITAPNYETKEITYTHKQLQKMIANNETVYLTPKTITEQTTIAHKPQTSTQTNEQAVVFKKAFPNPLQANGICYISYQSNNNKEVQLQLISVDGKVIITQHTSIQKGQHVLQVAIPASLTNSIVDVQVLEKGKLLFNQLLIVQ